MIKTFLSWFTKRAPKDNTPTGHKVLGLVKQEPDQRDYVKAEIPKVIPLSYFIQNLPPVRNQANIGSCASHAAVGAYEVMLLNRKPDKFIEGSELYHYYNVRKFINNTFPRDLGQTIRDSCKCLDKYANALEYAWKYNTAKFNEKPPWWAYSFAGFYRIKRYETLNTLESIKQSIFTVQPVLCGIRVFSSFYNLGRKNYTYSPIGNFVGNHAVLIVGYDDKRKVFTLRNSWAANWGNAGYFEMTYEDFTKNSFDWWVIYI